MLVRLKILKGSNAGKSVPIPAPKCVIGRGDDCHLRPSSDAVSRHHCTIITTENEVIVRDMSSRNGTFVNGERVGEEAVLLSGDVLRVGPQEFELVIEQSPAKIKRPRVSDIKEAVARTAEGGGVSSTAELGNINDWLDEGDVAARQRKVLDPDTRQFRLDETSPAESGEVEGEQATTDTKPLKPEEAKRPPKKAPGKLPSRPGSQSKDSREAAADMLKKFFNRR
jgi:pSer/pThr/pTyr-binding forkhead associated (FHA) protein